jgi:glutamyl-Q tRNA(Asp) synthetase
MPLHRPYIGRFAPSPTGPLHAGSVVTALASWLDARAHGGQWLVRIEDIDPPRETPGAAVQILETLTRLGLHWDGEVSVQSSHSHRYQEALQRLIRNGRAFPCRCSRSDIQRHWKSLGQAGPAPGQEWAYPGTCRPPVGLDVAADIDTPRDAPRSWRLLVPAGVESFLDRRCGLQHENVLSRAGDFVLRRADGLWTYQLAVVVDDAAQGITDIVRGEDLLDSTPRQRILQKALGHPLPRTLHVGLVRGPDGQKLSKQNGATAVDPHRPLEVLGRAMHSLGLPVPTAIALDSWLAQATTAWAAQLDEADAWTTREAG